MPISRLWLLAITALAVQAQALAPTISAEQRAKFWRSRSEDVAAQAQAERTKTALQQAIEEMKKACGESAQLSIGQDGEPTCTVKNDPSIKK